MAAQGDVESGDLVTIGDLDPVAGQRVEFDFIGRRLVERYQILAWIGGGGMADVFCAFDERLETRVAVKILKPRLASSDLRARMVQEARAGASVQHPQLIRTIDVFELSHTVCIVMELLDGPTLEQHLQRQPALRLRWDAALALLLPAMEALHAVHEQGFVHRDIKTGNLMLVERGGQRSAVVLDLGIVKVGRAHRTALSPDTTELGRVMGTPAYMSPEQGDGSAALDRRSDVYSMGVTLFRALAGRLPFPVPRGQSPDVVVALHCHQPPPMLMDLVPSGQLPPRIAAVVHRALAKDPADRPPTMLALAEALRAAAATSEASHTRSHVARPGRVAGSRAPLWCGVGLLVAAASAVGWELREVGCGRPTQVLEAAAAAGPPAALLAPAASRAPVTLADGPASTPTAPAPAVDPANVSVGAAVVPAPAIARRVATEVAGSPAEVARSPGRDDRPGRRTLVVRMIERSVKRCQVEYGGPERGVVLHPKVEIAASGRVTRVTGLGAPGLATACAEAQLLAQQFPAGARLVVQHRMVRP